MSHVKNSVWMLSRLLYPYWVPLHSLRLQCCPEYQCMCLGTWQDAKLRAVVLFSWLDPNLYISTSWFWLEPCFQQDLLNSDAEACMPSVGPTA